MGNTAFSAGTNPFTFTMPPDKISEIHEVGVDKRDRFRASKAVADNRTAAIASINPPV